MKTATLVLVCCICGVGMLNAQLTADTYEFKPEISLSRTSLQRMVDTSSYGNEFNSLGVELLYGRMLSDRIWVQSNVVLRPRSNFPESFSEFLKSLEFEGRYYLWQQESRQSLFVGGGATFELDAVDGRELQQLFLTLGNDWKIQPGLWLSPRVRFGLRPDRPDIHRLGFLLNLRFLQHSRNRLRQKPDIRFYQGRFFIQSSQFAFNMYTGEGNRSAHAFLLDSRFGYFITPFLVAGAELSLKSNSQPKEDLRSVRWNIGQFFRFYINPQGGHSKFFLEAAWERQRTSEQRGNRVSYDYWLQYGGGAGLNLFINPQLALECRLDYRLGGLTQIRGIRRELMELDARNTELTFGMQYFLE
ncbi:MAG: hypothetical protein AAF990_03765 [Bacteroidota bacterium]